MNHMKKYTIYSKIKNINWFNRKINYQNYYFINKKI
jgi:hypothetical protein